MSSLQDLMDILSKGLFTSVGQRKSEGNGYGGTGLTLQKNVEAIMNKCFIVEERMVGLLYRGLTDSPADSSTSGSKSKKAKKDKGQPSGRIYHENTELVYVDSATGEVHNAVEFIGYKGPVDSKCLSLTEEKTIRDIFEKRGLQVDGLCVANPFLKEIKDPHNPNFILDAGSEDVMESPEQSKDDKLTYPSIPDLKRSMEIVKRYHPYRKFYQLNPMTLHWSYDDDSYTYLTFHNYMKVAHSGVMHYGTFFDPDATNYPNLVDVLKVELNLFPFGGSEAVHKTLSAHVSEGTVNIHVGFYIATVRSFFRKLGVKEESIRFKQMEKIASWSAELDLPYSGWTKCCLICDQSHLTKKITESRPLPPNATDSKKDKRCLDDGKIIRQFGVKKAMILKDAFDKLSSLELEKISEMLDARMLFELKVGSDLFEVKGEMTKLMKTSEGSYQPSYIERLFCIGSVIACLCEYYYVDGVLQFPLMVAPFKVYIFACNQSKASKDTAKKAAQKLFSLLQKPDLPVRLDLTSDEPNKQYQKSGQLGIKYAVAVTQDAKNVIVRDRDTQQTVTFSFDDASNSITNLITQGWPVDGGMPL